MRILFFVVAIALVYPLNGQTCDCESNFVWVKRINRFHKQLQKELGAFVPSNNGKPTIYERKVVYEYPKNVGIIINRECASSAEQFLLNARQSEKVKLFGVNTWGCLDISNMIFAVSPCEEFTLGYGMSRSKRIPEQAIDEIGISPDYYIDETVPQYKWVEFVNEKLNLAKP